MNEEPELITDKDIARRAGFSPEWVRLQRHHRRHGRPHVLDIDPVIVGSKPRYLAEDVNAWFAGVKAHKEAAPNGHIQP
ncbi:MAG TPA: hypothetical protein VJ750_10640 [Rhizomicrobium sp.]|nr:hypothetical protein [Rhizomicrobium sp.]